MRVGVKPEQRVEVIGDVGPGLRRDVQDVIGRGLVRSGDLDTAIHIRTVVVKDGIAHIQAGGGTVADAKPAYEYNESVNKAKAVKGAIALAAQQRDWA